VGKLAKVFNLEEHHHGQPLVHLLTHALCTARLTAASTHIIDGKAGEGLLGPNLIGVGELSQQLLGKSNIGPGLLVDARSCGDGEDVLNLGFSKKGVAGTCG
jgi:hypothetical protein